MSDVLIFDITLVYYVPKTSAQLFRKLKDYIVCLIRKIESELCQYVIEKVNDRLNI